MTTLYQRIRTLLSQASTLAVERGVLPEPVAVDDVPLDRPRQASHGDLATNLCFQLAKAAKSNPRALAEQFVALVKEVDHEGWISAAEVAGPGFLNLRLSPAGWQSALDDVRRESTGYGQSEVGAGQRVLLEFVSANPTGPMHVGHGRGAVLGDALARVMRAAGYRVETEYYINNVGNQVSKLGESVWHWLRTLAPLNEAERAERLVEEPLRLPEGFPEDGYRGRYIAEAAAELLVDGTWDHALDPAATWADDTWWAQREPAFLGRGDDRAVTKAAWRKMLQRIQADLAVLDIRFDRWFSERWLHGLESPEGGLPVDAVGAVCQRLQMADWAYRGEPAAVEGEAPDADEEGDKAAQPLLFRGTSEEMPKPFRDGKDRVMLRGDGRPTYFAADIAYHDDKLARGYDHLVNILGADHHGYVSRLKGVLHALGDLRRKEGDALADRWSGDRLEVLLVQMVALLRDGKPVPMGKRSGEFVTLREVVDEVTTAEPGSGRDSVRFIFLTRKADAQLDFDLEVARRTTMDNPVYYVQYGHARLASILVRAAEGGQTYAPGTALDALQLDDERELGMLIAEFPEVVARAARGREPHLIAYYLMEACRAFHGYYSRHKADDRVITDDRAKTQARLAMVAALKQVIANGLALLGVTAPERMVSLQEGVTEE
jgi:arginyl-tRNA synthetase